MANLQFKRIFNYSGSMDEAVNNIKTKLNPSLLEGEPLICSYKDSGKTGYFLAIGMDDRDVKVFPSFDNWSSFESFVRKLAGSDLKDIISSESDLSVETDANNKYVLKIKAEAEVVSAISSRVTTIENNYETLKEEVNTIKIGAVVKVKDVDTTESHGISLSLDNDGKIGVNVDIDSLSESVISKHNVDSSTVKTVSQVGPNQAGATIQEVLENLNSRIVASAGGGVTTIVKGNGIEVDNTDLNNPVVGVKVKDGSSLSATEKGLDIV